MDVLQLLAGIARGFVPAQTQIARAGVLAAVHVLEQKSSEQQMGSLAEDLLAALSQGNAELGDKVEALRAATQEKKCALARAQRERLLREMGLGEGAGGGMGFSEQAKAFGWAEEDIEDEDGLVCLICHEGYSYKPEEVLGVYVFNKRCSIAQGLGDGIGGAMHASPGVGRALNDPGTPARHGSVGAAGGAVGSPSTPPRGAPALSRADRCFSSVCNMSFVHMTCHLQATRAERCLKVPRLEWDGASLRNQNTKCNNLLPVRAFFHHTCCGTVPSK